MYIDANEIYQQKMTQINNLINSKLQLVRSLSSDFSSVLNDAQQSSVNSADASATSNTGSNSNNAANLVSSLITNGNSSSDTNSSISNLVSSALRDNLYSSSKNYKKTGYDSIIKSISSRYGVSENLIRAVITAESDFDASEVSSAGAIGLMQLMPSTAKSLGVSNPYDPLQNIDGGVRYLKEKIDDYNGNVKMALAAYNCGPGKLNSLHITNINDPAQFARLPKETQNYINRIMKNL